mmetsp:Transcript_9839/g.20512  ORF Transcript_9839/g.20512 Transcript_9839/m.20512 type:complete len:251 (+) Transcript_9839:726-1478(+)
MAPRRGGPCCLWRSSTFAPSRRAELTARLCAFASLVRMAMSTSLRRETRQEARCTWRRRACRLKMSSSRSPAMSARNVSRSLSCCTRCSSFFLSRENASSSRPQPGQNAAVWRCSVAAVFASSAASARLSAIASGNAFSTNVRNVVFTFGGSMSQIDVRQIGHRLGSLLSSRSCMHFASKLWPHCRLTGSNSRSLQRTQQRCASGIASTRLRLEITVVSMVLPFVGSFLRGERLFQMVCSLSTKLTRTPD